MDGHSIIVNQLVLFDKNSALEGDFWFLGC